MSKKANYYIMQHKVCPRVPSMLICYLYKSMTSLLFDILAFAVSYVIRERKLVTNDAIAQDKSTRKYAQCTIAINADQQTSFDSLSKRQPGVTL